MPGAGIDTQTDRGQFFLDGKSALNGTGSVPLHKCLPFPEQYARFCRMIRHYGLSELVQSKPRLLQASAFRQGALTALYLFPVQDGGSAPCPSGAWTPGPGA